MKSTELLNPDLGRHPAPTRPLAGCGVVPFQTDRHTRRKNGHTAIDRQPPRGSLTGRPKHKPLGLLAKISSSGSRRFHGMTTKRTSKTKPPACLGCSRTALPWGRVDKPVFFIRQKNACMDLTSDLGHTLAAQGGNPPFCSATF